MISRFVLNVVAFIVLILGASTVMAGAVSHEVRLYHDDTFQEEQQKFIPSDTIYVLIDFFDLKKQQYALSIEWIRPDGVLVRNDSYELSPESEPLSKQLYFWMQLHEKGPLSQMLSGSEFSPNVYGDWKVRIYCNGEILSIIGFTMTDTIL
ncbi:hypothetical protein [Desulfopila sp. IMCC35008]|uniref:hypothetical protein n=1 Tax=Desulfopila sp. IMCC35008 TaxID=2653858 RepID=UPI0013D659DF|nr:hypothetical protein [Desulfopila sp. IMCC35008]